jgi:hypothetical protein
VSSGEGGGEWITGGREAGRQAEGRKGGRKGKGRKGGRDKGRGDARERGGESAADSYALTLDFVRHNRQMSRVNAMVGGRLTWAGGRRRTRA